MENQEEIWKFIEGSDCKYQISNFGRILSVNNNKMLSVTNKNGWYLTCVLSFNDKRRTFRIHQLVAEMFLGIKSSRKLHIHHIDGNKQNNRVENLKAVTTKEHYDINKVENPQIVLGMTNYNKFVRPKPIFQYDLDNNFIASYPNSQEASNSTGVCQRNILQVVNKDQYKPGLIRKQAGGFIWKFE